MMSMMHAMFSKELREHIDLEYGIQLKRSSLIYGSIKPDASTIFAKYPHYLNQSLDMLCGRIDLLCEVAHTKQEIETRAFARELGVATHYLADYFCRVHNDVNGIKHNEHLGHVIYEQKMYRKTKQQDLDLMREEILNRLEKEIQAIEKYSVREYILAKHRRYMKEAGKLFLYHNTKKRYELDTKYALEMILVVGSYIMEKKRLENG